MENRPFLFALPALIALALGGCNDKKLREELELAKSQLETVNGEVKDLTEKRSELTKELSERKKALREFDNNKERATELSGDDEPIVEYIQTLKESVAPFEEELEVWRKATRKSFEGMTVPVITTSTGAEFRNATVKEVTEDTLRISLTRGEETILLKDLSQELRLKFIHEPTIIEQNSLQ